MPNKRSLLVKKANIVTALVVGVVAVLFFGYLTYAYYPEVFVGESDEDTSVTTVAFTVTFDDGTTQTFESTDVYDGKLSVSNPMSVYTNGKKISSVRVACKATLNGASQTTITSWSCNTKQKIELYASGESEPLTASTGDFPTSGTIWSDGATKTVSSIDLSSAQIEAAIESVGGTGSLHLQVVDQVTLTVVDSYGQQTTLMGSAVGGLTVTYVNDSAMSITVTNFVGPLA
ncbi:MAG: hypothetical protein ACOWW1_05605 [archaeon]